MPKSAIITGITGQDGIYLTRFLLEKGYDVHGIQRRSSQGNSHRIHQLISSLPIRENRLTMHFGDLTDNGNLLRLVQQIQPDEIYNLAAQSHVAGSYETPEFTANCDALGPLRLLETIRILGLEKKTRFFQASTSELFGQPELNPQNEETPFRPRSPYGVAKLFAYWIVRNYREAHGLFACNGILFNHESPLRGENFVTRKITQSLSRIKLGLQDSLALGNINSLRTWGHARDYVEAQWLMLQQETPDDFVIGTETQHSVREFVELTAQFLQLPLIWEGTGLQERGINPETGQCLVTIDPQYFRPSEAPSLLPDSRKAREKLGWEPRISFEELVREMALSDLEEAQRELQGSVKS